MNPRATKISVAALKCDLASLGELAIRSMSSRYRINLIPNWWSVETIGLVSFMKVRGKDLKLPDLGLPLESEVFLVAVVDRYCEIRIFKV